MSKDIFTDIFKNNSWGSQESVSGPGSERLNCDNIIRELPILLADFKIKQLLDLPCGDFNWMQHVDVRGIDYTGADIVEDMINRNNAKYRTASRRFEVINMLEEKLSAYDLIMCRDCLFHFSHEDVFRALLNFVASGSTWLLTTTYLYRGLPRNEAIRTGQWTPLNLEIAPFFLPPPRRVIVEAAPGLGATYIGPSGPVHHAQSDRSMALWLLSDVCHALHQSN